MTNLLWFEWPKHRAGYRTVHFDPNLIDWGRPGSDDWVPPVQRRASQSSVELLDRYGLALHPGFDDDGHWSPIRVLEPVGEAVDVHRPLDGNPVLFREFADIQLKPDAIEAFANKFGQLERQLGPDRISNWITEIRKMRTAVNSWERAKEKGDLTKWVAAFNRRNAGVAGTTLHLGRATANIELKIFGDPLRPSLKIVPQTLIAALWLQFAQQASSTTGIRACIWCSKWFEYGTGTNRRKTGYFCSSRCRKAAHQDRREKEK